MRTTRSGSLALAVVSVFGLSASSCSPLSIFVKQDPIPCYGTEESRLQCETHCTPQVDAKGGDPNLFIAVANLNRALAVECNTRHEACYACISRLRQAKVIE